MLNTLKNISIAYKIALGFVAVFIIYGFLTFVFYSALSEGHRSIQEITRLTTLSAKILDFNREIAEIQKLSSVYSITGSESIISKINNTYKRLRVSLDEINKSVTHEVRINDLQSLDQVLESYGQNISVLREKYNYREKIVEIELPKVFESGVVLFNSEIKKNISKSSSLRLIIQKWYEIQIYTRQFLSKKEYKYKERISNNLKSIENILKKHKNISVSGIVVTRKFEDLFAQAVQANRIYLSLINVVMPLSFQQFQKN